MTTDGTDFEIYEPTPFDPMWYSHKFHGPGVRYEVGICIQTGWIVWINGPYPCGEWPDLRIARDALHYMLAPGEFYVADGGYAEGGQHSDTPNGLNDPDQKMKAIARARHETINGRFKQFNVLYRVFRHDVSRHSICFRAVANVVQMMMENGSPAFTVDYDDQHES